MSKAVIIKLQEGQIPISRRDGSDGRVEDVKWKNAKIRSSEELKEKVKPENVVQIDRQLHYSFPLDSNSKGLSRLFIDNTILYISEDGEPSFARILHDISGYMLDNWDTFSKFTKTYDHSYLDDRENPDSPDDGLDIYINVKELFRNPLYVIIKQEGQKYDG